MTSPGTERTPGSPSRTPEEIGTPSEEDRLDLRTPLSSERGGSPIVQEPEEPPEMREESSPWKTSLVIVESGEAQPHTFLGPDGDTALEKVRFPCFSCSYPHAAKLQTFSFHFSNFFFSFKTKSCQIHEPDQ